MTYRMVEANAIRRRRAHGDTVDHVTADDTVLDVLISLSLEPKDRVES
jgi:hypothetical protein